MISKKRSIIKIFPHYIIQENKFRLKNKYNLHYFYKAIYKKSNSFLNDNTVI